MKKIFCIAALLGFINHTFAQNTFPTSGNVGIGTTSPSTNLEVLSTAEQLRLSYNATNNLRFVVNATGNASITPSGGSLFLGSGATITTAGAFYGTNFYNYSNSSNATIGLPTTGATITRNIADANSALIINQANASSTGRIVDFQFGNSSVGSLSAAGHLTLSGGVSATDLRNLTSSSNAIIQATTTGTLISRNVADANPALTVTQGNAGSTGDILRIRNSIGNQMVVNNNGSVGIGTATPGNKLVVLQNNSLIPAVLVQDSGTGDASLAFNVSGASFTWGIDQSDSKKFKLSNSTTLGVSDFITVMNTTGNIGIGTAVPDAKLDVSNGAILLSKSSINTMVRPVINSTRIPGEVAGVGSNLIADDGFLRLSAGGGTNTIAKSYIDLSGYSTVPDMNTNIVMGTKGTERMRIDILGNVSIGTTDPKGYKFAVNGSAVATSMTVKLNSEWPDYVFKKDYKLPTLAEVKDYVDKNNHLPDMPSEKEVADNGLNLGEMNKILTKKVEELTLYLIEQNKRIEKLETLNRNTSN